MVQFRRTMNFVGRRSLARTINIIEKSSLLIYTDTYAMECVSTERQFFARGRSYEIPSYEIIRTMACLVPQGFRLQGLGHVDSPGEVQAVEV
jgi:hypothetical protein